MKTNNLGQPLVKPKNKVYKEREIYNNLKCCYNTKLLQKKKQRGMKFKKKEKDEVKMELRRDGTINTHPFSHLWSAEN